MKRETIKKVRCLLNLGCCGPMVPRPRVLQMQRYAIDTVQFSHQFFCLAPAGMHPWEHAGSILAELSEYLRVMGALDATEAADWPPVMSRYSLPQVHMRVVIHELDLHERNCARYINFGELPPLLWMYPFIDHRLDALTEPVVLLQSGN